MQYPILFVIFNFSGYQMLMKMGWQEGSGLGKEEQGITAPVNR